MLIVKIITKDQQSRNNRKTNTLPNDQIVIYPNVRETQKKHNKKNV